MYSQRIYISYLQLQEQLCDTERRIDDSKKILDEWIELLRKNPLLADNNRKAIPYIKLAYLQLNDKNYKNAIQVANEIAPMISHRPYNWIAVKGVEMYSSLYIGHWQVIDLFDLKSISIKTNSPGLQYIQLIKVTLTYFRKGFKQLLIEISDLEPLLENKHLSNSRLRIFEILIYLETEKIDIAIAKLEALRKHLSKYEAPKRVQATYKVLNQLALDSFDFGRKNEEIENMLIEMEAHTPWSPFSLEAVRFDTWVRAQYAKRSYWEQWKVENPDIFG